MKSAATNPQDRPSDLPAGYDECRFSAGTEIPAGDFGIVTAWNPMDRRWSPRMNRAADHRLRRWLERHQLPRLRITSMAGDGSHAEAGWMIPAPAGVCLALARRFRQRALWWIAGDRLFLVHCRTGRTLPLDSFSTHLMKIADRPE